MSLIGDLIYYENPAIWDSFGGTSSGNGGLTSQMFIWSVIVGLLVVVWLGYNIIFFRHRLSSLRVIYQFPPNRVYQKHQKNDAQNEPKLVPKGVPKWSQNRQK